jgi:hypothetical protein
MGVHAWLHADSDHALTRTRGHPVTPPPPRLAPLPARAPQTWSDCGDNPENAFSLDEMLTNISIYWHGGRITSSMRLYKETLMNTCAGWLLGGVASGVGGWKAACKGAKGGAWRPQPPAPGARSRSTCFAAQSAPTPDPGRPRPACPPPASSCPPTTPARSCLRCTDPTARCPPAWRFSQRRLSARRAPGPPPRTTSSSGGRCPRAATLRRSSSRSCCWGRSSRSRASRAPRAGCEGRPPPHAAGTGTPPAAARGAWWLRCKRRPPSKPSSRLPGPLGRPGARGGRVGCLRLGGPGAGPSRRLPPARRAAPRRAPRP